MKQLLTHLRSIGSTAVYRKGSTIYFQGEIPRYSCIVLDGAVKGYTITPEGNESVVTLFGKGSIIPVAWSNSQSNSSLYNYETMGDVRVLKVTRNDLMSAIDNNPVYQHEYLDFLRHSQAGLMLRITGLCQSKASEKICYTLYYLTFRYGIDKGDGMWEIDLKLPQSLLANLIGQTRESTAKNLKRLREDGVVEYSTARFRVNKPRLETYLGEDAYRE